MTEKPPYKIITGRRKDVEQSVATYMLLGYKLHGGLVVTGDKIQVDTSCCVAEYAQALVLIEATK